MHHLKLQIPFMPGSGNGSPWGLENPKHFPWNPSWLIRSAEEAHPTYIFPKNNFNFTEIYSASYLLPKCTHGLCLVAGLNAQFYL